MTTPARIVATKRSEASPRKILIGLLATLLVACSFKPVPGTQPLSDVASGPDDPVAIALEELRIREGFEAYDAVVVLQGERALYRWGDVDAPLYLASVRKSIISLLYGVAVESPGETASMKALRTRRAQYVPGEHFYYNNGDFNALGSILERRTGLTIGQAMEQWLARPLCMTRFRAEHVRYTSVASSEHRQYLIDMSAEDLARIGALVLQRGRFDGREAVPEAWIDASLRPWSPLPERNALVPGMDAYGSLWWLDSAGQDVWATGHHGQIMIVDRDAGIGVVTRNDYGRGAGWVWERLVGEAGRFEDILSIQREALEALGR